VWRSGSSGYYLWAGVDWTNFVAKWNELGSQNYRLIDIETYEVGGQRRYSGVWEYGTDGYYLWGGADWTNFVAKWNELGPQGLRLIDIETYMDGSTRKYVGVWRAGTYGYYLYGGLDWTSFTTIWNNLGDNYRLTDIETYMDGSTRKYIGIWEYGTDGYYLWGGSDWATFVSLWDDLASDGLRLIDVETYLDGSTRKYIGVWRSGTYGYYLWSGVDWENFVSKWAENGVNNLRLIDYETFETNGCPSTCLNHALLPDNTSTSARESYNYGIKGSTQHCEAAPDSCPSTPPAYVYYRWPNVVYGSTYYLRLSALNTNNQIFRLPFNDAANTMGKNGWLYSSNSWHHAIDYWRNDGSTFQIVAASTGKVIHIGWDNWSGNTVILSHDVGTTKDVYRTIYVHMRNGPSNDCANAWTLTVPSLSTGSTLTNYQNYLANTGCPQNTALRNPSAPQWGTTSQTISVTVGQTVSAGTVLGWAGSTGPGGCGCTNGGNGPNTHLHIFWAHRDTDGLWYFFDPYGVYASPDCYPSAVDGAVNSCSRYPVAWKNGKPGYV